MISILVPAYNFDIRDLVRGLHVQLVKNEIKGEIIVVDDCSIPNFKRRNKSIESLDLVDYEELENNLGRSAIRNYLSSKAKYEYLLFLDCDMKLVNDDFVKNYYENLALIKVLIGGIAYQKEQPTSEFVLHWKVGKEREVKSAETRQKAPYKSFLSSNFLIPKSIFQNIRFDESIRKYGHEDTLFGLKLKELEIPIIHLENPIEHAGLETAEVFLNKTEQAIENLWLLYHETKIEPTKLVDKYLIIRGLGMEWFVFGILNLLEKRIRKNLISSLPFLVFFDLFKLKKFHKTQLNGSVSSPL